MFIFVTFSYLKINIYLNGILVILKEKYQLYLVCSQKTTYEVHK